MFNIGSTDYMYANNEVAGLFFKLRRQFLSVCLSTNCILHLLMFIIRIFPFKAS